MACMLTPKIILNKIQYCISSMQSIIDKFVVRPGKDFSRPKSCTFSRMLKALMSIESHSIDKEIFHIFPSGKAKITRNDLVTQSAFVQARAKFNSLAFPFLFNEFNRKTPFSKTKDGLHFIGIDGSDYNVPADIKDCNSYIPYNSKEGGYYQYHLNFAYDLLEGRYSDVVIQPRKMFNEPEAACDMVDRKAISGKCLYCADRGYHSFNLMAHIMEKKDFFLIREKDIYAKNSPFKDLVPAEGSEFDIEHTFIITRRKKKGSDPSATYKLFTKNKRFDFIPADDKESVYEIPFRLVAIKLDNEKMEYLITNLSAKKYPPATLKEYYRLRWNEEVSFLHLKYGVALKYFHSIKREFLVQEIYAKLILFNFISLLVSCVEIPQKSTNKYEYKPSFSHAIDTGRGYLLGRVDHDAVIELLLMNKTPIRPGRKYKRNMKSQRLRPLQHRS